MGDAMRLLDWQMVVDEANYRPTLFDEVVIVVGGVVYDLAGLRVLVQRGDDGPGIVASVAGDPLVGLTAAARDETPERGAE
jgi:hypothetical protein